MAKFRFEQIAFNSTEKKKPTESDKATYLGLEHLDSGCLTVKRFGSDTAPIGEKLIMKKGDVLFGKRRAYQKKVAIAPFDGIFSAHGMVLRPREDVVDKEFFPLFISSDYFLDAAIKISVGSLSPTINWRDLKDMEFELPPLEEQKKLAEALWAVNRTIETYKNLLEKTDELVKSQFMEMIYGATKHIKLTDCADVLYGYPFNSKLFNSVGEGIPLIRIRDINSGFSNTYTTEAVDEKYIVMSGDCVIGMDGNFEIIKWKNGKSYLNQRVCKITPRTVGKEYLMYLLKGVLKTIEENAQSTTVKHLSAKDIESIRVPIINEASQTLFEKLSLQTDKSKFAVLKCSDQNNAFRRLKV